MKSQHQTDKTMTQASQVKEKREVSFRHSRRVRLAQQLFMPVLGTLFLVVFILVSREFTNRREHLNAVKDLQMHLDTFKKEHNRLPYRSEVSRFKLNSRIKAEGIRYEADFIHEDSPSDAPLAYTGLLRMRFFTSGHAVLEKTGKVHWLTPTKLAEQIKRRDQHHAVIMSKSIQDYLYP